MSMNPFGGVLYQELWGDAELARLFSESAEIRAMLVVEGALAEAQGQVGMIPRTAASAIKAAAFEVVLDPVALASGTGENAVPVPALVEAFRKAIGDDEVAQWVHFGSTSQDIMDTALALRLRQVLNLYEDRLQATISALGSIADEHADLPMAARTYGQAATPTSFGAVAAAWGRPLLALHGELEGVRDAVLQASLGGAAGTLSAMDADGARVREAFAKLLDLRDPQASWHSDRSGITLLSGWIARVGAQLGKIGDDLLLLTHNTSGEVRLSATGGSSTMPQKTNPVQPSQLVALARFALSQNATMQFAAIHREQRDGASWMTEWLTLPGLVLSGGRALGLATEMVPGLTPVPERMLEHLDDGSGLIFAEALSFRLAQDMPRPKAQAAVKSMSLRVRETGASLANVAKAAFPDASLDNIFNAKAQLGTAPSDARSFAVAARAL